MKVGINGMGRMGRLVLRAAMAGVPRSADDPRQNCSLDIVHLNEARGDAKAVAHLLEFDSVHGRWRTQIDCEGTGAISVAEKPLTITSEPSPGDVPWGDLGCDIVLECSGAFRTPESLDAYFERGVKRVIVAAPVKDERALNVVVGVNDHLYDPDRPCRFPGS